MILGLVQRYAVVGLAAGLVAALGLAGYQRVLLERERTAHQATIAARHAEISEQERAARAEESAQRETEKLRRMARDRTIDDLNSQASRRGAAAADLRTAADRVRDKVGAIAASAGQACGDPASAASGASAASAGVVLADLYGSASREAEELAAAVDDARSRGLGCERIYDSLTAPK